MPGVDGFKHTADVAAGAAVKRPLLLNPDRFHTETLNIVRAHLHPFRNICTIHWVRFSAILIQVALWENPVFFFSHCRIELTGGNILQKKKKTALC